MLRSVVLPSAVLRRGLLAGAAVTAMLALSACGGHSASSSGMEHGAAAAPSAGTSAASFNGADVMFAQMMILHHRQAVQMAEMVDGRAIDPEVITLAGRIKAAQQPEIDTMTGWLTAWAKPAPMASGAPMPGMSDGVAMPGMDHGMPGMMSDADMTKLMNAKGADFDKQFLTMMISHHEGAITMAQTETAGGANPDAKSLAQTIVIAQQAEITTMKGIVARL
jgi:uncharacterized protein (DUF305 family)